MLRSVSFALMRMDGSVFTVCDITSSSEDDVLMNLLISRLQTVLSTRVYSEIAGNFSGNYIMEISIEYILFFFFFKFLDLQYFFGCKLLFVSEISMKLLFINDMCGGLEFEYMAVLINIADILSLQSFVFAMHPFVLGRYFFLYLHVSPVSFRQMRPEKPYFSQELLILLQCPEFILKTNFN